MKAVLGSARIRYQWVPVLRTGRDLMIDSRQQSRLSCPQTLVIAYGRQANFSLQRVFAPPHSCRDIASKPSRLRLVLPASASAQKQHLERRSSRTKGRNKEDKRDHLPRHPLFQPHVSSSSMASNFCCNHPLNHSSNKDNRRDIRQDPRRVS